MIVKKFQAQTETDAILKAKKELGNSAVVVNVKSLKQRGIFRLFKKDLVEVTAALEERQFAKELNEKNSSQEFSKNSGFNMLVGDKNDVIPDSVVLEEKLDSLHTLLKKQINKGGEIEDNSRFPTSFVKEERSKVPQQEEENTNYKFFRLVYSKLIENDVNEKYANEIMNEIETSLRKESNIDSILASVYQKIILKLGEPKPIVLEKNMKVVFFIGPTGVGKTTTIAKVASSFKLDKESKVAFITADTYRIAAVEQLNTYAQIIDCPVTVIYSPQELSNALKAYEDFDLVLVDTAGRSHKSDEQMTEIIDLLSAMEELKTVYDTEVYLTLSMTTKYQDLKRITEAYKDFKDYSIIFTKLDETCSMGNILNVRLLTGAPLSYTTSGQNVPNDIQIINEQWVAKQLLGGNE